LRRLSCHGVGAICLLLSVAAGARPYAGISGLAATADSDYSGLGPRTERVFQRLGIFKRDISVERTSPQSVLAGIPGFGSLEGEFDQRDTLLVQVGLSWGDL
jgi:hypothetical protein